MCQPATRGILFDALCAMHESGRSSLQGTPEQLSRVLRCSPPDLSLAIKDFQQTGAVDVRDNGHGLVTITSRRMDRDIKERTNATNRKRKERGQPPIKVPGPAVVTPVSRDGHGDISEVIIHKSEPSTNEQRRAQGAPTLTQAIQAGQNIGCPKEEAERFWNHFEAVNWLTKNNQSIHNWQAKLASWWTDNNPRNQPQKNGHTHTRTPAKPTPPAPGSKW